MPLQILLPVLKPLATKSRLVQLLLLDHGPHGSVKNDDAFLEQVFKRGHVSPTFQPLGKPPVLRHHTGSFPDRQPARPLP